MGGGGVAWRGCVQRDAQQRLERERAVEAERRALEHCAHMTMRLYGWLPWRALHREAVVACWAREWGRGEGGFGREGGVMTSQTEIGRTSRGWRKKLRHRGPAVVGTWIGLTA